MWTIQSWLLREWSDDNVQTQLPLLSWWIESRLRHVIYVTTMDQQYSSYWTVIWPYLSGCQRYWGEALWSCLDKQMINAINRGSTQIITRPRVKCRRHVLFQWSQHREQSRRKADTKKKLWTVSFCQSV